MNRHLSSQQVSEWTLGERTAQMEQHVGECPLCRTELSQSADALVSFRKSARQWSEEQAGTAAPEFWRAGRPQAWISVRSLSWALAALVILVVASVAVSVRVSRRAVTDSVVEDAALLKQVDEGVSQAAPRSLEPLLQLVSLEDSASAQGAARGSAGKATREQ